MTMTRIEIEQYGHTWRAEVEGGTGLLTRKRHVQAADFPEMIAAVVQAWAEIHDREPIVFLRSTGEILRKHETEAAARREKLLDERAQAHNLTYDDLGNEEAPPALRRYPARPKQNPEIPPTVYVPSGVTPDGSIFLEKQLKKQTRAEMDADFAPHHTPPDRTDPLADEPPRHVPFAGEPPRRGPGRPRKEPAES